MALSEMGEDWGSRMWDTLVGYSRLAMELARPAGQWVPPHHGRHLLLLASGFPPDISGGTYRPASFARYANRNGWEITVIAGPGPEEATAAGKKLVEYVGTHARVLRVGQLSLQPSYRLFAKVDGDMTIALDMVTQARRCFGDRLPDVIMGTGPSFAPFVAAYLLARSSSRKLVLEYRDEWTLCPFDFVSSTPTDVAWERRCLARADQIILTTESQRVAFLESFGAGLSARTAVIPNGWEPDFLVDRPAVHRDPTRLVLTFAGRLGGHADPRAFLETLSVVMARRADLRSFLQVRFVGPKDAIADRSLATFAYPGVIESRPVVPSSEVAAILRASDGVVLFHDERFHRYIPGKIYEYAASGSHILLFDDKGESARIVSGLGLGDALASGDAAGLEAVLDRLALRRQNPEGRQTRSAAAQRWIEDHRREALAASFFRSI